MSWRMQVATPGGWMDIRPVEGKPYEYSTAAEAGYMLRVCYPDQCREDRLNKTATRARVVNVLTGEKLPEWQT